MSTITIEYLGNRDRELWVVGFSGNEWRIPILCDLCEIGGSGGELAYHVQPAVAVGFPETRALEVELAKVGAHPMRVGWLVRESEIGKVAEKASGITPEFYYKWNGESLMFSKERQPEAVEEKQQKANKDNGFLKYTSDTSGIPEESITVCWLAICQSIPNWLMSGKPVDFGFFRLVGVPFRRNWREILLARYPSFRKILMVKDPRQLIRMVFAEAGRMIRSSDLTLCRTRRGRHVFGWTVEVLHGKGWRDVCEEVELAEATRVGHVAYVKRWASKVSRVEELIYELLSERCVEEVAPTCRVSWRRGERGARFVQASPTIVGLGQIVECDEGGGQSVDDFLGISDKSGYLEEAAARLLEVSSLRQGQEDVRPPRGDDPKPSE